MAKLERCACCGQIIPPKIRLTKIKQHIYDLVVARSGFITRSQLRDLVYAEDPDGGPNSPSTINVHINQMNKKLAKLGVAIRSSYGREATYRIEAL